LEGGPILGLAELQGLIAGAFVTGSLVPQVIKVFQLKSAREISMLFTTMLLLGLLTWLSYGVSLRLVPIILWNAIGASLAAALLYAKLRYGK
jgi:MtN3 and saliva related transmembrane protein